MKTILLICCLLAPLSAWAETPLLRFKHALEERGVTLQASYTGEYFANTRGGIERDQTYQSKLASALTLDTEKLGWWQSGRMFIHVLSLAGGKKLSQEIVGDLQTVSNIEAPHTSRLYELWYEHHFFEQRLSMLAGIHDYNAEFALSKHAALFLNSSFGVAKTISAAGRPSIFPIASPGARAKFSPNERWDFLLGVYDGDPDDPEDSEHFSRFDFDRSGGVFIGMETAYHYNRESLPGTLKLGGWYGSGRYDHVINVDDAGDPRAVHGNYGAYLTLDQHLLRAGEQGEGLAGFVQLGTAAGRSNECDFYAGAGLRYKGLFAGRREDEAGVALAHAAIADKLVNAADRKRWETAVEATYRVRICDGFWLQPDVQYIFNPGANPELEDALVAGVRFEIAI